MYVRFPRHWEWVDLGIDLWCGPGPWGSLHFVGPDIHISFITTLIFTGSKALEMVKNFASWQARNTDEPEDFQRKRHPMLLAPMKEEYTFLSIAFRRVPDISLLSNHNILWLYFVKHAIRYINHYFLLHLKT